MMDASKKFPKVFVSLPTHELSLWIKVMVFQALGYQEKAWKAIHYKKNKKKVGRSYAHPLNWAKVVPKFKGLKPEQLFWKDLTSVLTHSCQHWLLTKWLLFKPNYNWLPQGN